MKKVLLTSTALVMTAGIAFAEVSPGVSLSGSAEIGVKDVDDGSDIQFHSDLDLDINFSGETDGGLAFGASIDLDEVSDGIDADGGPAAVFISYAGHKLEMGDVDGALDLVNLETTLFTSINDDHTAHAGFFSGSALDGGLDGQIATYSYSGVPGLLLALSLEVGDGVDDDEIWGAGIRYTTDLGGFEVSGSLGYQDGAYAFDISDAAAAYGTLFTSGGAALPAVVGATNYTELSGDAEIFAISLELETAVGFTGRLNYADLSGEFDTASYSISNNTALGLGATPSLGTTEASVGIDSVDVDWDFYGIVLGYETGALAFEVNYGEFDAEIGGVDADADGYGIAVNYDLGGGAQVQVGFGSGEGFFSDDSTETWSAGLALSF